MVREKLSKINDMPAGGLILEQLESEAPRIIEELHNIHGAVRPPSARAVAAHAGHRQSGPAGD
eukprot:SAG11_NODE_20633_length_441_cov_1.061404_2_plen_62_part_01